MITKKYIQECLELAKTVDHIDYVVNDLSKRIIKLANELSNQVEPEVKPACDICDLKRFCKIYQLWVSEEADYFNKDRDDFYCKHFESGKNTGKIAGM